MKIDKRKNITKYDFKCKPKKPTPLIYLARLISKIMLLQRKTTVEYKNMENLKRPYLLLSTHASFNDFYMLYKSIKTSRLNYVVALDAFKDVGNWVLRDLGGIAKRKFISDLSLMKNMKYSIDVLKDIVVMYPEARYTLDGATSYLPPSLGKLVKFLNVPVVVMNMRGTHVSDPQFNKYKANKMPMEATLTQIITANEISELSVEEINERIKKYFVYDDWKWLAESGTKLTCKTRAHNLNAILYKCPFCKTEFETVGEGTTLKCNHCQKVWDMGEDGKLTAQDGKDIFTYITDWTKWEKEEVYKEVFNGTYNLQSDCEVFTMPNSYGFVKQGKGELIQNSNETILKVNLYGEDKTIVYKGTELESVHVEYAYQDMGDALDFSIRGDSIWMHTLKKDVLTKVSFATEAIRDLAHKNLEK